MQKLQLGFVGCDYEAVNNLCLALKLLVNEVQIVAACDLWCERLNIVRNRFSVPHLHENLEAILQRRALNGVFRMVSKRWNSRNSSPIRTVVRWF